MKLSQTLENLVAERHLLKHPFYQAWSEGRLDLGILRSYAAQYFQQVSAFPRFVSGVHARCPEIAARKVLLENLVDEELHGKDHPELWLQFAESVGARREEVLGAQPLPETQGMVSTFYALTSSEWTDGLCALYAYEAQVPAVAESKMDGLKRFYGIDDPAALEFFSAHLRYDVEHSAATAALVDRFAQPGPAEEATRRARDAQWAFLDGMCREAGISCQRAA